MTSSTNQILDPYAYPHSETLATQMMADAFRKLELNNGPSQRQMAARLGYKTSVVLSHMALGRVPVPIDRASQLAHALGMDEREFLLAVLEQRHPGIEFRRILTCHRLEGDG